MVGYSFRRGRYGSTEAGWDGIVVLSPRSKTGGGKTARWQFGQPESPTPGPAGGLPKERLLEEQLKVRQRTLRARKDYPEMVEGVQQGFGSRAGRRWMLTTES